MPEGDTLRQAAARLGPLVGHEVVAVGGSHRAVVRDGRRLVGRTVTAVEATGKHLVVETGDWAVRTHLGMTGAWHRYRRGERWRMTPGKARLVIETAAVVAVCFAAPRVEVAPTERIRDGLTRLGPDLLDELVDWDDALGRARRQPTAAIGDVLLDQQVTAGIGNVYRNEVLFLEGIHPDTAVETLDDAALLRLWRRARRLLHANVADPRRTTTGVRTAGRSTWVYGRSGRSCRRCGARLTTEKRGDLDRVTIWCPRCQPAPHGADADHGALR